MHERPILVATEQIQKLPVLIIDKKGVIGAILAEKLQEQFLIVLVSGKDLEVHKNIIHIPYRKKIPMIPDNAYSHMFMIYNGESEMLDLLPAFVKKANQTNSRLLFITQLVHSSEKLLQRLSHPTYQNIQTVIFGEPFGDNVHEENGVTQFIHQVRALGKIEVPHSGLGKLYPILFDEALAVIIVTAFSQSIVTKPILVFPKHSISELSVGRMLQKINPLLRLDFKKQKSFANEYYIPPDGQYFFSDYNLEERLRKLNLSQSITGEHRPNKKRFIFIKRKKDFNNRSFFWIVLIGLLILPFLISLSLTGFGIGSIQLAVNEAEKGNFSSGGQYASYANHSFKTAKDLVGSFFLLDLFANKQKNEAEQYLHVGEQVSETMMASLNAAVILQNIYTDKSSDPKSDFFKATATLKNTLLAVQKLQAEDQLPKEMMTKLTEVKDVIALIENTIDTYPSLLGFEGKRKYLLLFQNNMELRPGGGFIGSYGLLDIEHGKMSKFQIYDVYDADGKLKDHIEPPYPLRRYLGAAHWYLRDSNFAIDFPTSAAQASSFLRLETGETVDGVISIDTDFLKSMLSVVGPVTVADYKETVTAENFYLLTQTHAEKDFFPGSTQKKDFLRSLANTLLLEITEGKGVPYQRFLKELGKSIKEKHLLFASPDSATQQLFTVNNLSSSLWDGRKKEQNTFLDFLGVIDANLGANKANYYVNKSVQQDVVIGEDGSMRTTVSVTYLNTSKKDSIFGGEYKNYIRFVVPDRAALQNVTIDNQTQPIRRAITDPADFTRNGFISPKELEVDEAHIEGKKSIGFLMIVPMGETKTVSLTYRIQNAINEDASTFLYDLFVFKQPGTHADPFTLFVSYPGSFKVVKKQEGLVDVGGKLSFSENLSKDRGIQVEFTKR